jgi:hypothetical protein
MGIVFQWTLSRNPHRGVNAKIFATVEGAKMKRAMKKSTKRADMIKSTISKILLSQNVNCAIIIMRKVAHVWKLRDLDKTSTDRLRSGSCCSMIYWESEEKNNPIDSAT